MAHQVKPISFRAGKTQVWDYNVLSRSRSHHQGENLLISKGLGRLGKTLLRKKRLYFVQGNSAGTRAGQLEYRFIYAPKIKTKPREHATGAFIRRYLYKPVNLHTGVTDIKSYVQRRKEKIAKIRRRFRPKKLNKWLTRRMFRGSAKLIKRTRSCARLERGAQGLRVSQVSSYLNIQLSKPNRFFRTGPAKFKKPHVVLYHRKIRHRKAWCQDSIKSRRFNNKNFSAVISNVLQRPVKALAYNLFAYLTAKRVIGYKSHQNHFWNVAYRRYRFQYKNYFDITNACLSLGLLDGAETFLLSVLRATLPVILKIRRFFKFLNTVVRGMPEIQDRYSVFKLHIAGKLAGGTKRTKAHSIGYGVLPAQTLNVLATNTFLAYRHIYGEFGLKLITCKHVKYKSLMMLA